jgi:hypothetical protein
LLRVDSKLRAYEDGYKAWANAKGGVFTVPVSEIAAFAEKALK